MANWPVHSRDATIYGTVTAIGLVALAIFTSIPFSTGWLQSVIVISACGTVMVVFPDTDHHNSRPRRYAMTASLMLATGFTVWALLSAPHDRLSHVLTPANMVTDPEIISAGLILGVAILGVVGFGRFLDRLPHRGPTHGAPGMIFGGIATGGFAYLVSVSSTQFTAAVIGFLIGAGGVLVHRVRDELS